MLSNSLDCLSQKFDVLLVIGDHKHVKPLGSDGHTNRLVSRWKLLGGSIGHLSECTVGSPEADRDCNGNFEYFVK